MQTNLSQAYVRCLPNEDVLKIQFYFRPDSLTNREPRLFNFERKRSERLSVTLPRIAQNINRRFAGKVKKQQTVGDVVRNARLLDSNEDQFDNETQTTEQGFRDGYLLCLDEAQLTIRVNSPTIIKCQLSSSALAGFPLYPQIECEFSEPEWCQFEWFIHPPHKTKPDESTLKWNLVSDRRFFLPLVDHVGSWLKLVVTPRTEGLDKEGFPVTTIMEQAISEGPKQLSIGKRTALTSARTSPGQLRLVSYNLLANVYTDSDYSRDDLFSYCPSEFLCMGYRQHLLLRELIAYNADLLCLQEVDVGLFNNFLYPALIAVGFHGIFQPKENCSEGMSIFYRRDRLSLEENVSLASITQTMYTQQSLADLCKSIVNCSELHKRWGDRTQSLVAGVFTDKQSDSAETILVGNTHLYFKPDANHIRILQTAVILDHLKTVSDRLDQKPAYLLAGDWNSNPSLGVCQFISTGKLASDHPDWLSSDSKEYCSPPLLEHSLHLKSAYTDPPPDFTNYTPKFHAALDHIFYESSSFSLSRSLPLPTVEEVTELVALPNREFPSDHLAIVADLEYCK